MSWSNPFGTYHVGDVIDVLRTLPADSLQCVVTSPPYWALRDYGTATWEGGDAVCDHVTSKANDRLMVGSDGTLGRNNTSWTTRDATPTSGNCPKCGARRIDAQLGLESTPEAYVARMVEVFREVRRVMRDDAVAFVNLGDSYQDKQLAGIPWRVAFALQADGWWLRSPIVWYKPNPMPESVTDRPTKSYEHVFLLTKRADYFYDSDAIRETSVGVNEHDLTGQGYLAPGQSPQTGSRRSKMPDGWDAGPGGHGTVHRNGRESGVASEIRTGRNARDVWTIATAPYKEAHFATFPPELVKRCILAGTSERGCCPTCGAPWERVIETDRTFESGSGRSGNMPIGKNGASLQGGGETLDIRRGPVTHTTTTGWRPTCEHGGEHVPCTILDPFMGSGTTALVAQSLNRKWVGIDLSPEYAALAQDRCGTVNLAMAL